MPALNLRNMDVDALLDLRSQIDGQLATRRGDLQKQLARLQRIGSDAPAARIAEQLPLPYLAPGLCRCRRPLGQPD